MTTSSIIQSISSPRLSSYKEIFDCADDATCFSYYLWNQRLSSELYILFSTIEICLRNRIHIVLSEEVSLKFTNKVNSNFNWYDYFDFTKNDKGDFLNELGRKLHSITHEKKRNLNLLPQVVISQLSFGNWNFLISYTKKYKNGDSIEWKKLFPLIFPNSKKSNIIINQRVKLVRCWRNRISHLEPAWKFSDVKDPKTQAIKLVAPQNKNEVIQRLNQEINLSVQLLSWLCTETYEHYKGNEFYEKLLRCASRCEI